METPLDPRIRATNTAIAHADGVVERWPACGRSLHGGDPTGASYATTPRSAPNADRGVPRVSGAEEKSLEQR